MRRCAPALALLALLSAAACKSGKPLPLIGRELPPRSPERLLELVQNGEQDTFRYFNARASVDLKLPDGGKSFKAHIRSVRDSATWISVVPVLGIEVARVLFTRDSVKVMDKLADQYFVGDTATARAKFGPQPSLALLQQAMLGKAMGLDPRERYRSDREDGQYVLTSREKRRFIRAAEDIGPGDTLGGKDMGERRLERTLRKAEEREAIVLRYWIDPDAFRVTRVQVVDLARDQTADIRYEERAGADAGYLPTRVRIILSEPGRQVSGTLELSKITFTGPSQMNFRIPGKFTPMP